MPLRTGGPATPGARTPKRADRTPSAAGHGRAPWKGRGGGGRAAAGGGPGRAPGEGGGGGRGGGGRPPRRDLGQRGLELSLRILELAGELSVEIAPRIDRRDQRGPRRDGAFDRRARLL